MRGDQPVCVAASPTVSSTRRPYHTCVKVRRTCPRVRSCPRAARGRRAAASTPRGWSCPRARSPGAPSRAESERRARAEHLIEHRVARSADLDLGAPLLDVPRLVLLRWNWSESECPALHEQDLAHVSVPVGPDQLPAPRLLDAPRIEARRRRGRRSSARMKCRPRRDVYAPAPRPASPGAPRRTRRPGAAPSACSPSATFPRGGTRAAGPRRRARGRSCTRGRRARAAAPAPPRRGRRRRS